VVLICSLKSHLVLLTKPQKGDHQASEEPKHQSRVNLIKRLQQDVCMLNRRAVAQ